MVFESRNSAFAALHRAQTRKLCSECNTPMALIDRCHENGTLFLWYQCTRKNCAGQWLQKIDLRFNDYPGDY